MAIFDNTKSFFDDLAPAATQDLATLQLAAGSPEPSEGISTVSDPIIPDRLVRDRLGHLDPTIYDLRDESHLMRLLKVLLGAAGMGGARKQMLVARLQNALNGMHFLDLDKFYGALFGIRRSPAEQYLDSTFDPYTQPTTPGSWDDIHARDASYRDRLTKFSRAIPMGASYAGLKAMAEALTANDVDIFESWAVLEEQALQVAAPRLVYLYTVLGTQVGTWGAMEGTTWGTWGGGVVVDTSRIPGSPTRSDFVVKPRSDLTLSESYELLRVLSRFKPAGTQLTIEPNGLSAHTPADIRSVSADSEYWEVVNRATASAQFIVPGPGYPISRTGVGIEQARPAFSGYQGEEWSYNDDIAVADSYALDGNTQLAGSDNDEQVRFSDGIIQDFQVADAIMSGQQAMLSRIVSDGVLTAGAYVEARGLAREAS